jgi:hypothetical protein
MGSDGTDLSALKNDLRSIICEESGRYGEDGSVSVKFMAENGSIEGPVYEVRLFKN